MAEAPLTSDALNQYLLDHLVRYTDLVPCTTAFIDTRTPGSEEKENFTIIGPGVAENPNQHVHIKRPHGFNIGGARQPPRCINSQHNHLTAEVFTVLSGQWIFTSGEAGEDGRVELGPGDTISIPTNCFRGFENVGDVPGFLFAVLGGDDPGRVLWAPYVFDMAQEYGLVLLESGELIDTAAGEEVPQDATVMPVTSAAEVASLDRLDSAALERCVVRHSSLRTRAHSLPGQGIAESPIIGTGPLQWPHGFSVSHMVVDSEGSSAVYVSDEAEVFLMYAGELTVNIRGNDIILKSGDVFTAEAGQLRTLSNTSAQPCEVYVVRGGD